MYKYGNKKNVIITIFLIIILLLLTLNFSLPKQLNSLDGSIHYQKTLEGAEGYPPVVSIISQPFSFSEKTFWLFWFIIISVVLPLFLFYYTKRIEIILGYFFFTGLFFNFELYQVYPQVIMSFVLIFFLLEKHLTRRLIVLAGLLFLISYSFSIHAQEANLLLIVFIVEIFLVFWHNPTLKHFMGGACLLPTGVTQKVTQNSLHFRKTVYFSGITRINWFDWIFFYSYHFFVKNMLFLFSIPALIQIWKDKNIRTGLFFIMILGSAIFFWWYSGWQVYTVTRVLMWLPLVLLPSFMLWLSKRTYRTKLLFWAAGLVWFVLQVSWYFVNKSIMVC